MPYLWVVFALLVIFLILDILTNSKMVGDILDIISLIFLLILGIFLAKVGISYIKNKSAPGSGGLTGVGKHVGWQAIITGIFLLLVSLFFFGIFIYLFLSLVG